MTTRGDSAAARLLRRASVIASGPITWVANVDSCPWADSTRSGGMTPALWTIACSTGTRWARSAA